MKTANILIPTDFSLTSLNVIPALVQQHPDKKFSIVLVNFLGLSDSITDLLMLSRRSREHELISREFLDQCNQFKRDYANQIACLQIEFFYGTTVAMFKNYLEARDISQIAKLQDHRIAKLTSLSYDPDQLLQRSKCPVLSISPAQQPQTANAEPAKKQTQQAGQPLELMGV